MSARHILLPALLFGLCASVPMTSGNCADRIAPPKLTAQSAILMDAWTGKVLYEKACRVKRPLASTTKIMTAILAIELGNLDEKVCVSRHASSTPFASLHLREGETLTLRDLLCGMLLRSGNDAAVCVAEHIAESEEEFVRLMNEKAQELGAVDTHFTNPHGLHDPDHYSTAYDLALIARYAIRLPVFNELVRLKSARIERSINKEDVYVKNNARFLWRFDGADGIKTGYTKEAGRCFVGSATRDGWRLIAVVLKSEDAGADTEALLNYGFGSYQQVSFARRSTAVCTLPVRGGVEPRVQLVPAEDLSLVRRKPLKMQVDKKVDCRRAVAPIKKGEKLGTLTGYLDGKEVGSVDLLAAESVDRTLGATVWFVVRTLLFLLLVFVFGFLAYGTAVAEVARRRRRSVAQRS